jgi:ParB-like chromosome segregation protein Spo0J
MARAATAKYPKPVAKLNDMMSTINKVKGSAKGVLDLDGVTRNTTALLMVSPELIRPIKGFNPRIHEAKDAGTGKSYADELEELKNSIQTEGFFLDKPISGYPGVEDGENVVYIIDGHRRMEAVQALIDEGVEIGSIPVVLTPANTDPIKLVIQNVKKNLNRRFTFFETSFQVARLLGIGKSKADIVELMGLTEVAVQDCLDFIEIVPEAIREHVKLGRISGTEALRICRQNAYKNNPDKAVAKVQEMIDKAESEGRTKASRKDDPDSEPVKSRHAVAHAGSPAAAWPPTMRMTTTRSRTTCSGRSSRSRVPCRGASYLPRCGSSPARAMSSASRTSATSRTCLAIWNGSDWMRTVRRSASPW